MRIRVSTPGWRPQKARQNTASSPTLTNCAFTTTPANTNLEASKLSGGAVDSPSTLIKVAGNTGVSGTACATGDGLEASGSTLPTMQTVPSCQPIVHHDAVRITPAAIKLAFSRSFSSGTLAETDSKVTVFEPNTTTSPPSNVTSINTAPSNANLPLPAPPDGTAGISTSQNASESGSPNPIQTSEGASTSSEHSSTTTPSSAIFSVSSIHILSLAPPAIIEIPTATSTSSLSTATPKLPTLSSSIGTLEASAVSPLHTTTDASTTIFETPSTPRIAPSQVNSPEAESTSLSKSTGTPSQTDVFGTEDPLLSSTATTLPWHLESTPSSSGDTIASTSSTAPSSSARSRSLSRGGIAGICISVVLALLLSGAIVKWCAICRRRRHLRELEERRIRRQNSIAGESFARLRMSGESTVVTEMASVYDPASIPPTVEVRAPSATYDLSLPPVYPDVPTRSNLNINSGRSLTLLIPPRAPRRTANRDSTLSQDSTTLPSSTYLDPAMVPDDWTEAWNRPRPSSELMRSGESSQTVLPLHEHELSPSEMVIHAI